MAGSRCGPLHQFMQLALDEARAAAVAGDVPVGAVLFDAEGKVLARAHNERDATGDPMAHAEVLCLQRAAAVRGHWRLDDCTLVVTLEPCTMCAGAIVGARIRRIIFGAWDPKAGAAGSVRDVVRDARLNHQVEVIGGIREAECSAQLRQFFEEQRPDRPLD